MSAEEDVSGITRAVLAVAGVLGGSCVGMSPVLHPCLEILQLLCLPWCCWPHLVPLLHARRRAVLHAPLPASRRVGRCPGALGCLAHRARHPGTGQAARCTVSCTGSASLAAGRLRTAHTLAGLSAGSRRVRPRHMHGSAMPGPGAHPPLPRRLAGKELQARRPAKGPRKAARAGAVDGW